MNKYQTAKENARNRIIEAMNELSNVSISWGELAELQAKIERLGRKYGLLQELRENGVI